MKAFNKEVLQVPIDKRSVQSNKGKWKLPIGIESSFPKLQEAYIDLEYDDCDQQYQIPATFIPNLSWPNIKELEFAGDFSDGDLEKLNSYVSK